MRQILYCTVAAVLFAACPDYLGQKSPQSVLKEAARNAEKENREKSFQELKAASTELAAAVKELNEEIDKSSSDVISAAVFSRLDKIEKLTKQIRGKAK